jgi:metal-responsive CopG/Arc/MetJ family transcriptional regulator
MSEDSFVRIQFDLPKSRVDDLDRIARAAGITTRKELFNNAVTLLDWAIKQREAGKTIGVAGEEGRLEKELSMPILDSIKHR